MTCLKLKTLLKPYPSTKCSQTLQNRWLRWLFDYFWHFYVLVTKGRSFSKPTEIWIPFLIFIQFFFFFFFSRWMFLKCSLVFPISLWFPKEHVVHKVSRQVQVAKHLQIFPLVKGLLLWKCLLLKLLTMLLISYLLSWKMTWRKSTG